MTTEHISFERMSDMADGLVGAADAVAVERHLSECAACRETYARLHRLLDRAASLPSRVEPPANAWASVRSRVAARPSGGVRTQRWLRAESWFARAAAAVLLVAGSSALTVLVLRSREAAPDTVTRAPAESAVAIPAAVRAVDDSYAGVVEELTTTLHAQRGSLAPSTIATIERTLRIIDEAIAEARRALAADPGNAALLDVLSANYEQKVQLLRRASELPART
jgi:anti-sigma factor RsiW